jgi:predicted nuclease of predicted toxin-antitoxin system
VKFLADVNVDRALVIRLRADGHEVLWLAEKETQRRLKDRPLMALAYEQGAIILTNDREFVGYVFRDRIATHGVVLLRVAILRRPRAELVQRAYEAIRTQQDHLPGNFTTIYPNYVESIPLPTK